MKKFMARCKKKCRDFCTWIWEQCKDIKTLILLGIVCLVLFSPTIVCGILGFLFKWEWAIIVASAYWAFWLGPFSPFFVLAVTITLAIKRLLQVIFGKKKEAEEGAEKVENAENAESSATEESVSNEPEPIIIEADEVDVRDADEQTDNGSEANQ